MSHSGHRWWRLAVVLSVGIVAFAVGVILYGRPKTDRVDTVALNAIALGTVALILSIIGAWITRRPGPPE